MACYKPVTHVIFDMDGTLITSDEVAYKVLESIAVKYGKSLSLSQKVQFQAKQSLETFRVILKELDVPVSVEEYCHDLITEFRKPNCGGCKLKPGVERLVKHLHDNNIPIAIATNSPKEIYDITSKNFKDLISFFNHSVTAPTEPEVERDKPAPDVFLVCARRFEDKPSPEKVLVIEDAPAGVEAAIAAGMQVVIVPHPLLESKLFKNATIALETLDSFKPELFGLPPFSKEL